MKKVVYIISFFTCFIFQSSFTNSPILLNAQPGWTDDQRLVFLPGGGWDPRAACCGDTIHLVWWQSYPVHDEVFYKRSTDAGLTWEDDVQITQEDTISAVMPCIAVWESNIHVVWKEQTTSYSAICYRKSEDGGDTWGVIDTIWQTSMDGWYHPWIAANKDNVFLTAIKSGGGGLVFIKSTDNGNSWLSQQSITYALSNPHIESSKLDSSFLVIVYFNGSEISIVLSFDAGESWSDTQVVSEDDGVASQLPSFDIDETDGLHISWYDYKYSPYAWTGDIFYRVSRDSGQIWEVIHPLTVMHRAVASDILAEGSNLHVVWEDDRHGFDNNFEIYYRMSSDSGETWMAETRLTNELYWSICPSLACGGGYLHLFWRDCRDSGNNGIGAVYYKRKDLSHSISESHGSFFWNNPKYYVYPNPFSQTLDIGYPSAENPNIRIYNLLGKEVIVNPVSVQAGRITIDTKDLPSGLYFVHIETEDENVIKKVVKAK